MPWTPNLSVGITMIDDQHKTWFNHAEKLFEAGIQYAVDQIRDLIINGVDGIHLYTMNNPKVALKVYEKIEDLL